MKNEMDIGVWASVGLRWKFLLALVFLTAPIAFAQDSPRVSAPEASPSRGFFREPFDVKLSTRTSGATIHFTTDGSLPSKRNGTRYSSPIRVEGTASKAVTTLRAVALRDNYQVSESVTWTYIFVARVPAQPSRPSGFPDQWGEAPDVDYGMDAHVTTSADYKSKMEQSLLSLPSVSVVADVDDLFGRDGIYSNSTEHGDAWERPASVELLFPDGRKGFQENCGLRISGGASREPEKSPKHSFRVSFRDEYGPRKLEFPLFPGSPVERFDNLILRYESSGGWTHHHFYHREKAQFIRNRFTHNSQLAMGHLSPRGRFVHCYLNGLYWGLYDLMERPNAAFLADHLGGAKEDYDAINGGEVIAGDEAAWEKVHSLAEAGLSSLSAYETFQALVDVTNLADYMVLNFYAGTSDWSHHNWYVGRKREKGAQFKFFVWDAERAIEEVNSDLTGVDDRGAPSRLFTRLRANEEFRLHFADRVQLHLLGNGALTARNASRRWVNSSDQVAMPVIAEAARWGDYRRDIHPWQVGPYELYTPRAHWQVESREILSEFFPERTAMVLKQLRARGLFPRLDAPEAEPVGDPDAPRSVKLALPSSSGATIYYTLDGSDPRAYGTGEIANTAKRYENAIALAGPTLLRARARRDGVWSALCHGSYLALNARPTVVFSEIMYNPPGGKDDEFLELHNPGSAGVDLGGMAFTEGIEFTFPERTVLPAGGHLVLVANAKAFRTLHPRVEIGGVFAGGLDNAGEKLTLVDEAGNKIVSATYDNEAFWPLGPDGFGYSLVLADVAADPDRPFSWRASAAVKGSPGAMDLVPRHGGVVINEILTQPASALREDAIELLNTTSVPVDISGWWLSDDRDSATTLKKFRVPSGTILAPLGFVVFYEADFNPRPGDAASFTLDGKGDAIYLAAADNTGRFTGHIVGHKFDAAEAGVALGRTATSTGFDFTALSQTTFGADDAETLATFRSGQGTENAPPRISPVVISEIHYHPLDGGDEFLELHNRTAEDVPLYDEATALGWRVSGLRRATGEGDFELLAGALVPARGYLVICGTNPEDFRRRHGVPAAVPVVGPFAGGIDDSGEAIELARPAPAPNTQGAYIVLDRIRYNDKEPWPTRADGSGPSLERVFLARHGNEPAHWSASTLPDGSPGLANSTGQPITNLPPIAAFHLDPASGQAPLLVSVDGSTSSDPDGRVISYSWNFGDGTVAAGAFASHTYAVPGDYVATLAVTDDQGVTVVRGERISVVAPEEEPAGDPLGSAASSFVVLKDTLARFPRAVLPPIAGKKRSVDLAGSAWLLNGTARHKLKGARTTSVGAQVVLAFGPLRFTDEGGAPLVNLSADQFLLVDAENRRLVGAYSVASSGKTALGVAGDALGDYAQDFILDHPPAVPLEIAALSITKLSLSGKGKASKTGDTFKLSWKTKLTVQGSVNQKPGPASGTMSFSGVGTPLR